MQSVDGVAVEQEASRVDFKTTMFTSDPTVGDGKQVEAKQSAGQAGR